MSRFVSIAEVMADLQKRAMKNCQSQQESGESVQTRKERNHNKNMKITLNGSEKTLNDTCPLCSGTGMILNGWTGRMCDCQKKQSEIARLKNAMIPEEFEEARFKNYIRHTDMQKKMFNSMMEYLKKFNEIRDTKRNSFGYIATYGEGRLKALSINERVEKMKLHNNYGLGKTHLQIAAARWIIKNVQTVNKEIVNAQPIGCRVVCISDVTFMTEIMSAKRDDKKECSEKLHTVVDYADVLVWDDLGKSKHTESREEMYYEIINERYKRKALIIFSSNEDEYTLPEKIGFAAADRLLGMADDYLIEVESMEQLAFEDSVGNMDYTAHRTVEKFLSNHSVTPTYAVEFFDRDKKQKLRWFEVNTGDETKYREIQIIKVYVSNRTLKEIMELD